MKPLKYLAHIYTHAQTGPPLPCAKSQDYKRLYVTIKGEQASKQVYYKDTSETGIRD